MTDVAALVSKLIAADGSRNGPQEADVHALRRVPLLDLCKELKEICLNPASVPQALHLLSAAATERPMAVSPISEEEILVLLRFFSAAAQADDVAAAAAVSATAELLRDPALTTCCTSPDALRLIVESLLPVVRAQGLPTQARRSTFAVYRALLSPPAVYVVRSSAALTSAVVRHFVPAVDGERDPELVLEALALHAQIASSYPAGCLEPHLDDYFDALSSYFPIVFYQPSGCAVTKCDLRAALAAAMGSPAYADVCIPFLCEKLASPGLAAKTDATELLVDIVSGKTGYSASQLSRHTASIVRHVRNEVVKASAFTGSGNEVLRELVEGYLRLLHATVASTGESVPDEVSDTRTCVEPLLSGAMSALSSGETVCQAYATMINAVSRAPLVVGCVVSATYLIPTLTMTLQAAVPGDAFGADDNEAPPDDGISVEAGDARSTTADVAKWHVRMYHGLLLLSGLLAAIQSHRGVASTAPGNSSCPFDALEDPRRLKPAAIDQLLEISMSYLNDAHSLLSLSQFRGVVRVMAQWLGIAALHPTWLPPSRTAAVYDTLMKLLLHLPLPYAACVAEALAEVSALDPDGTLLLLETEGEPKGNAAPRLALLAVQLSTSEHLSVRERVLQLLVELVRQKLDDVASGDGAVSAPVNEESLLRAAESIVDRGDIAMTALHGYMNAPPPTLSCSWFRFMCTIARHLPERWHAEAVAVESGAGAVDGACEDDTRVLFASASLAAVARRAPLEESGAMYWVRSFVNMAHGGTEPVSAAALAGIEALLTTFPTAALVASALECNEVVGRRGDGPAAPLRRAYWGVAVAVARGLLQVGRTAQAWPTVERLLTAICHGNIVAGSWMAELSRIADVEVVSLLIEECISFLVGALGHSTDVEQRFGSRAVAALVRHRPASVIQRIQPCLQRYVQCSLNACLALPSGTYADEAVIDMLLVMTEASLVAESGAGGSVSRASPVALAPAVVTLLEINGAVDHLLRALRTPVVMSAVCASLKLFKIVATCALEYVVGYGDSEPAGAPPRRLSDVGVTADLRRDVISVTGQLLGHPKRRIRQAASQCRHQWFKLKG